MPATLDLLIGLTFVFLIFSLVVTALNELILSWLDRRATFLREGLEELLGVPSDRADGQPNPVDELCKHPLVNPLSRRGQTRPSYIDPTIFARAYLDFAGVKANAQGIVDTFDQIENESVRRVLTTLSARSGAKLADLEAAVEAWYGAAMERVAGWYKKFAQTCIFWLALVLAIAANVDTIRIAQVLGTDPALRTNLATQAFAHAATTADSRDAHLPPSQKLLTSLNRLDATGLPLGWDAATAPDLGIIGRHPAHWNWLVILTTLCGWLLTALAATLGAPFWFDLLNRFIIIRGNGRAPDERAKPPTKESTSVRPPTTPTVAPES